MERHLITDSLAALKNLLFLTDSPWHIVLRNALGDEVS